MTIDGVVDSSINFIIMEKSLLHILYNLNLTITWKTLSALQHIEYYINYTIPFNDGKDNRYDESPADRISPFIPTFAVSVSLSTLTVSIRRLPVSKRSVNTGTQTLCPRVM